MNDPHCCIYTLQLDSTRTVSRLSPEGYFIQPMISRTGDAVVFWGRERGEAGFNIWRHDGALTKLTSDIGVTGHPFWTADGRHVVYFTTIGLSDETDWRMKEQLNLGRTPRNIWIMDREGKNRRQLTSGRFVDERPCISPDGKTVVFVSDRSGHMNLCALDVEREQISNLTRHEGFDYRPVFSPQGDRLAFFTSNNARRTHDLCVMDWPDGEACFPIPPGLFEWVHGPYWLPDGASLLLHAHGQGRTGIWRCYLTKRKVELVEVPGFREYAHASIDDRRAVLAFDSHDQ